MAPALHPPSYLDDEEAFDRGFYAGPFGWISGCGAEFVVAIRSGLALPEEAAAAQGAGPATAEAQGQVQPGRTVHLYAGVGVVEGSDAATEWQELELKTRQLASLLSPSPPLAASPNINIAWARLLVEELCRQGVDMFCVAPGEASNTHGHGRACVREVCVHVCS